MLRKLTTSAMAMSIFANAFCQDSTQASALTITGNADMYYKYDFANTKGNNYTSFTNSHRTFELGMASVKFNYKAGKTEVVADLGFGKRAQEFSYNDEGILASVKQLYISYSPTDKLKLTAGSWATHVGYELVDATLNRNYSMSYMFTNGPFFHTGVKAELTLKSSGLMIGIANPTDYKYVPDGFATSKTLIAQYSYSGGDKFKAYLNYAGGRGLDTSRSDQFDLVLTSKLSDKFGLGFNGTVNNTQIYMGNKIFADAQSWWGSALYVNFDPSKTFGLTLREEYFSDKNGLKVYSGQPLGGNVFATTLSGNLRVDNFILIPEFRFDKASEPLFTDSKGVSSKSAASFLIAAVYQF
ncbi:MAG: outer membrane beta-barrel protein [Bacteroidota bacterium]